GLGGLELGLILRCERGLLAARGRLRLVPRRAAIVIDAHPLALPVGILRLLLRARVWASKRHREREAEANVAQLHLACSVRDQLFASLIEISQVRRRLVLAGGHEHAVAALEIALALNKDVLVVLAAMILDERRLAVALVAADHGPGPCQGVIDG